MWTESPLVGTSKLAARSNSLFNQLNQLDPIARKSGLLVRHSRKFCVEGFVLSLFKAAVNGKASFHSLAIGNGSAGGGCLSGEGGREGTRSEGRGGAEPLLPDRASGT